MQNSQSIEHLNHLLSGELSAIETYEQALQRIKGQSAVYELRRIADDHRSAAETLRQQVRLFGGIPVRNSGAWGMWAKTAEGTATMLGEDLALRALKVGEEHGLKEYQDVLNVIELAPKCRTLISSDLMCRQRQHINTLDQYQSSHS